MLGQSSTLQRISSPFSERESTRLAVQVVKARHTPTPLALPPLSHKGSAKVSIFLPSSRSCRFPRRYMEAFPSPELEVLRTMQSPQSQFPAVQFPVVAEVPPRPQLRPPSLPTLSLPQLLLRFPSPVSISTNSISNPRKSSDTFTLTQSCLISLFYDR